MGIPDFLKRVLESAGRPCDLRDYANGITSKKRPLRVGLDVSTWIYTGAYAYGDMLGDERHLSNYGRANLILQQQQQQLENHAAVELSEETVQTFLDTCVKHILHRLQLLQEATRAEILIVLDGIAPPIKKREVARRRLQRQEQEHLRDQPVDPQQSPTHINHIRTKANRRAGAGKYHRRILTQLVIALREAQQPFLVAPYEADAQLAYLAEMGYLDLVISEDSDLVAHGTKAVLFKLTLDPPQGKLLKFADLGAGEHWNLASFTPVMMTILFVAVGCDYCDKLKGIGIVTATRAIQNAFLSDRPTGQSKLGRVLEELYTKSYLENSVLTKQFKREYEERFLAAIFMFRHAIVYDPLQERNVLISRQAMYEASKVYFDPELMDHEPYVELCQDFGRIQEIVGTLWSKEFAMKWAQGYGGWMTHSRQDEEEDEGVRTEQSASNNTTMPAAPMQHEHTQQHHTTTQDNDDSLMETQDDVHLFATQEDVRFDQKGDDKDSTAVGGKSRQLSTQPSTQGIEEAILLTQQDGSDPMEGEANTQGDDEAMLLTQQEGISLVEGDSSTQQGEDMLLAQQDGNDPMEGESNTQEEDEAMPLTQQDGNTLLVGPSTPTGQAMPQSQMDDNDQVEGTAAGSSDDEFFDTQSFVP